MDYPCVNCAAPVSPDQAGAIAIRLKFGFEKRICRACVEKIRDAISSALRGVKDGIREALAPLARWGVEIEVLGPPRGERHDATR